MDKHPDSDLIDAAGGTSAVARLCNIKPPSVTEWRKTGIPDARRMYLELRLPDVFGSRDQDAATGQHDQRNQPDHSAGGEPCPPT